MQRSYVGILNFLLIISTIFALDINPVKSYNKGPGGAHYFILDQAKLILKNDGYVSLSDFLDQVCEPGKTYLDKMKDGSDFADSQDPLPDPIPDWGSGDHYMSPFDHVGLNVLGFQFKSAAELCQERFDAAVSDWIAGNYGDALHNLGWAAHLVQDVCVPFHAAEDFGSIIPPNRHVDYENWVDANKESFAVDSDGIYSFDPFPDREYYPTYNSGPPSQAMWHYDGMDPTAFDWVDYNAHESLKFYSSVNFVGGGATYHNLADPIAETTHPLPNNLETTFEITMYQVSRMNLHFEKIDMDTGDYVRIYDENNIFLDEFTGVHGDFWAPSPSYPYNCGDALKIKVSTQSSGSSWGYKIYEVKFYDEGDDLTGATSTMLSRAQRTTAGFIKFFLDKVLDPIHIRADGTIYPPTSSINHNASTYTFTADVNRPVVIERDNIIIHGNHHTLQGVNEVGDGFYMSGKNNVTIEDVVIRDFWNGMFIRNSTGISISGVNITSCGWNGIDLRNSTNNKIEGCFNTQNGAAGIYLIYSSGNNILHNKLIDNTYNGIYVHVGSDNNRLWRNHISDNGNGVRITSLSNKIQENNMTSSTWSGIYIDSAAYLNNIYHNYFINNPAQISGSLSSQNTWDNGYPSGGNYWDDYVGEDYYRGLNQNISGCDGIGDLPYTINMNNQDSFPLITPYKLPSSLKIIPEKLTISTSNIVGQNITIACVLENMINLAGFDIKITWDPSWLNYTSHTITVPFESFPNPILPSPYGGILHNPIITLVNEVDIEAGTCNVAMSTLGGSPFNGSGTVFIITLQVMQQPTSDEKSVVTHINFTEHIIANINANQICHTLCPGSIEIPPFTILQIIPNSVELELDNVVGQNITVACILENVVQLYGFETKISWNPMWLSYVNHTTTIPYENYPDPVIPSPYGGILYSPTLLIYEAIDEMNGTCQIAASSLGGPAFSGGGTIFIITFQVIQQPTLGEKNVITSINFTMHTIANYLAQPIHHVARNGTITIPALRNIAISNVTPSKTVAGQGYPMTFNITINNHGYYLEDFNNLLYVNSTQVNASNLILPGLNSTILIVPWNTTGFDKGLYIITSFIPPIPGENYTTDNIATYYWIFVSLPGDTDKDRDVDIFDIVRIATLYTISYPDPLYNPNIDIDDNGTINIFDIVAACSHYQESW